MLFKVEAKSLYFCGLKQADQFQVRTHEFTLAWQLGDHGSE